MSALKGIKVLDISHFIAGPLCSQMLADHGADVIKVEALGGEQARASIPFYKEKSIYFATMNRNKRSLAINMKTPEGRAVIERLIKDTDILVTNFSAGVPEKLGFDYDTIAKINPQIVMVHITGYGLTGPMQKYSAFDGAIQCMSGLAHLTGKKDGPPTKAGLFIADHVAAFHATIGALVALQSRNTNGVGQLVDISMLDSMVSMLQYHLSLASVFGISSHRAGNRSTNDFATIFASKDGYIYIAPLTPKMWLNLSKVMGKPELAEPDSPYADVHGQLEHYDYLEELVESWTKTMTTAELVTLLRAENIACGEVNTIEDVLQNEQLQQRNMLMELDFEDIKITVPGVVSKLSKDGKDTKAGKAPMPGEQSREILQEHSFTTEQIQQLEDAGVIGTYSSATTA